MERRWAVISEHGCEADDLTYDEAVELMRRLKDERVHGLCIVTNEAARHFLREGSTTSNAKPHAKARSRTS